MSDSAKFLSESIKKLAVKIIKSHQQFISDISGDIIALSFNHSLLREIIGEIKKKNKFMMAIKEY